jgi:histidine triad (HIT) family protein
LENCLFCKIASGEIDSEMVYSDEHLFAIQDINPQAPTHLLIIPKKHFATLMDIEDSDKELMGSVCTLAKSLARESDLEASGFRLVLNCGSGAGQSVFHIHFHLLGGRPMKWPPG